MQYIVYEDAVKAVRRIAVQYKLKNKEKFADAVSECEAALGQMKKYASSETAEIAESERICQLEPFLTRGLVGRDVYHCGRCGQVVGKRDRYCKFCGRRLIDKPAQKTE